MSPPVRSEDPENPKSSLPRCRFLDYCLITSMVLLTLVVGSLCTLYVAWERPSLGSTLSAQVQMNQEERNAQLVVDNAKLENGTLDWSMNFVTSTFVGRYFKHEGKEIVVQKTGFYFISSQITLKCVDYCQEEGEVSLSILKNIVEKPILKVFVHIHKPTMKTQPSSFSGSVRHLSEGDRIRAELWTSHENLEWQFDREYSVLGLTWMSSSPVGFQEQ